MPSWPRASSAYAGWGATPKLAATCRGGELATRSHALPCCRQDLAHLRSAPIGFLRLLNNQLTLPVHAARRPEQPLVGATRGSLVSGSWVRLKPQSTSQPKVCLGLARTVLPRRLGSSCQPSRPVGNRTNPYLSMVSCEIYVRLGRHNRRYNHHNC